MDQSKPGTRQRILEAGRDEFLAHGFRGASLRRIVKQAGVTTGAFYGYFKSKEALFDALVEGPYTTLMNRFDAAQEGFAALTPDEQFRQMGEYSGACIDWMTDYLYEEPVAFRLLLCCAGGTRYESFVHRMVETEVAYTHRFMAVMGKLGHPCRPIDPQLEHILVSGMFSAFFEIVIHDMPQSQAHGYVQALRQFYTAGWKTVMGLPGD